MLPDLTSPRGSSWQRRGKRTTARRCPRVALPPYARVKGLPGWDRGTQNLRLRHPALSFVRQGWGWLIVLGMCIGAWLYRMAPRPLALFR